MAKYGSPSIVIEVDDSGGVARNLSQYILDEVAVAIEALLEESHAFGDSWREYLSTGLRQLGPITFGGFYDDVANGPHVVFKDVADSPTTATRTVTITWGGGKTTSFEVVLSNYTRKAIRGQITKFTAVGTPTGLVTEV